MVGLCPSAMPMIAHAQLYVAPTLATRRPPTTSRVPRGPARNRIGKQVITLCCYQHSAVSFHGSCHPAFQRVGRPAAESVSARQIAATAVFLEAACMTVLGPNPASCARTREEADSREPKGCPTASRAASHGNCLRRCVCTHAERQDTGRPVSQPPCRA